MTELFERKLQLPVTAAEAFQWHERPGALDRLIPPWETVRVDKRGDGIQDGSVVELVQRLGPMHLRWVARHHDYQPGRSFVDTQVSGPFASWEHLHKFEAGEDGKGILTDHIEYQVPGGMVGKLLGGSTIKNKVETMFTYRHNTTEADLKAHARYREMGTLHVAVTGAGGLVGSTLVPLLTTGGHQVTRMVRREAGEGEAAWDPQADSFDASHLDGVDAVVHLAGENIAAGRWSPKLKVRIRDSRVHGTRVLCEGLARMQAPPRVLVVASAIGYYGDRGDEILDEEAPAGEGFLADVSREWEEATQSARDAGIRVVNLRYGIILSPKDGALAKMLTPFSLGGGGCVGSGKQYWSWISVDDAAGSVHHALMTESLHGPVNAVAPDAVTNAEFTKALGRVLRRPTVVPIPGFGAKLALGEMAEALLLASTRVHPRKLLESGYEFRQPTLESALRHLLGRTG